MPSFVVTLAGFLIWSGVVLILDAVLDGRDDPDSGRHRGRDRQQLPERVLGMGSGRGRGRGIRRASAADSARTPGGGPGGKPTVLVVLQTVGLAVVTFAAVWYLNEDRGVPQVI